ncbi:PD40 domain-containing protein [Aliikangiella sp. G2MR2-5]|uniref:TolB family protein n=1 Tax=Aliikangiella sp. G2MR2-5 TaxID=2788943 RepID=UPI0018AA5285|nr:PD40 domain-containing protein [Aliikangiella sp. G2MR2-5]
MKKLLLNALSVLIYSSTLLASHSNAKSSVALAPGTEVFLYEIKRDINSGKTMLSLISNVSQAEGYDNQPSFSPDNQKLLYVSARDGKQMDIYEYDIASKKTRQLTQTPENEFSPMLEANGKTFTAVREGGDPYQSVHRYPYPTSEQASRKSSWAVKSQTPIGYYAFAKDGKAVAWARWANAIYIFEPDSPYATFAIGHAAPSKPLKIPATDLFSFVHRQGNDELWIKSIEPASRAITPIAPVLKSNIDYAWTPHKELISASDSQLYLYSGKEKNWNLWADLSSDKIFNISRLAISSDFQYIAVVAKVAAKQ